ncbi:MAG: hypothetical protein GF419_06265, partial [Ignavibacteriales bacterium]|nr:hypothetical protein [Ignavibacteriales bacterium]
RRLQEERYLWYQTIAASRERFHASYPEKDARGETTPSAFLLALERVAKIERRRPNKSVVEAAIGRRQDAGNLGFVERLSGKARAAFAWKVEGAYSASRLETYARCPKKYFYQYVLRLDEGRKPSEEPAPLDVGTLAHEILAEFYEDDAVNDALRSDAPSALFEAAADRLFAIAERRIAESGFDAGFSPSVERLTGIDGDRRRSLLRRFLEHERRADDGFRTIATERRFGFPGTPTFRAGEVELRGAIDRIDRDATRRLIRAIDYKTGAAPSADDYEKGLALQLPLYAAAARAETGDDPAPPAIFSLRYNEEAFGLKPLGGGRRPLDLDEERDAAVESANDAIRHATRLANEFVADIRAGRFPYSKLDRRETRACAFCLYRGICRVEEQTDLSRDASNFRTDK